ncbi:unnamed protein product [Closterium sp. NIES-65]|nr:unnamed protein product [Closterium sp. NIES-65]
MNLFQGSRDYYANERFASPSLLQDLQWYNQTRLLHADVAADGEGIAKSEAKARPDGTAAEKAGRRSASRRSRKGRRAGDELLAARDAADAADSGEECAGDDRGDGVDRAAADAVAVEAAAAAAGAGDSEAETESENETRRPVPSIRPPRRSASRASRTGGSSSRAGGSRAGTRPGPPVALNVRDDRGWTMLHIASHMGNVRMVRGNMVRQPLEEGDVAVRQLLKEGDVAVDEPSLGPKHAILGVLGESKLSVRQLLEEGDVAVDEPSLGPKYAGATALHLAAAAGHIAVMDALLEGGANIEARTRGAFGWTPLHHAARHNRRRAIRFLLESGAFLAEDMQDPRFNPPLHYCRSLQYAYQLQQSMSMGNGGGEGSSSGGGSELESGSGVEGGVVGEGGEEGEEPVPAVPYAYQLQQAMSGEGGGEGSSSGDGSEGGSGSGVEGGVVVGMGGEEREVVDQEPAEACHANHSLSTMAHPVHCGFHISAMCKWLCRV